MWRDNFNALQRQGKRGIIEPCKSTSARVQREKEARHACHVHQCGAHPAGEPHRTAVQKFHPPRFSSIVTHALGLCVLGIGVSSAVGTQNALCVIVCMVVGTILGEALRIEDRLDSVGARSSAG